MATIDKVDFETTKWAARCLEQTLQVSCASTAFHLTWKFKDRTSTNILKIEQTTSSWINHLDKNALTWFVKILVFFAYGTFFLIANWKFHIREGEKRVLRTKLRNLGVLLIAVARFNYLLQYIYAMFVWLTCDWNKLLIKSRR